MISTDVLTSPISLGVDSVLSVDSGSLLRAKVKGTAADTNDMIVYLADAPADRASLYIQNLAPIYDDYPHLSTDTDRDRASFA